VSVCVWLCSVSYSVSICGLLDCVALPLSWLLIFKESCLSIRLTAECLISFGSGLQRSLRCSPAALVVGLFFSSFSAAMVKLAYFSRGYATYCTILSAIGVIYLVCLLLGSVAPLFAEALLLLLCAHPVPTEVPANPLASVLVYFGRPVSSRSRRTDRRESWHSQGPKGGRLCVLYCRHLVPLDSWSLLLPSKVLEKQRD
jgi:hypothetical protein